MMSGKRQKLMNEHIKLKNGRVPYGYLYDDENKNTSSMNQEGQ